jgi:hypothetical protein
MTQSTHRLSIERIEQATKIIDPVFLNSPQFVCEPLSEELGKRLALKLKRLIRSDRSRDVEQISWCRRLKTMLDWFVRVLVTLVRQWRMLAVNVV